jgi:hypothetical protein
MIATRLSESASSPKHSLKLLNIASRSVQTFFFFTPDGMQVLPSIAGFLDRNSLTVD